VSTSRPNSREWDGRDSGLVISDISAPGETMTFRIGAAVVAQTVSGSASPNVPIPDAQTAGISSVIAITRSGTVAQIKVGVDIEHPFIGDLHVTLRSPGGKLEVLHARLGGGTDNLRATYDSTSPGLLSGMLGQSMQGSWVLTVADRAAQDVGRLKSWKIELQSAPVGAAPPASVSGRAGRTRAAAAGADRARTRKASKKAASPGAPTRKKG